MPVISVGQTALPFSLTGIDRRTYTLNENGARLTLAVFFKTTCPTCVMAWPYLERLHRTYQGGGLAVWGISQDARDVSSAFASKQGSSFPILVDADWHVSRAFDPDFVPTLLLIDAQGQIIASVVGLDKAKLNQISEMIAGRLGVPAAIIAPPDDGNPPFKMG